MEVEYITALSAIAGSLVGGLTSGMATWMSARSQAQAGHLSGELMRRQDLFRDFIVAASKCYGNALTNNDPQIAELVELYALMSRMRVLCSPKIVSRADEVLRLVIETYFRPNRTVRELHELVKGGTGIDPLKDFSDAAREELQAFAIL